LDIHQDTDPKKTKKINLKIVKKKKNFILNFLFNYDKKKYKRAFMKFKRKKLKKKNISIYFITDKN
jgi:hypothetical protein